MFLNHLARPLCMFAAGLLTVSASLAAQVPPAIPPVLVPTFPDIPLPATSSQVYTAVVNGGLWASSATWIDGTGANGVPGPGDVAQVPLGITVNIRSQVPATLVTQAPSPPGNFWPGLRYVRVDGTLRFGIHWDTELVVDTLFIAPTGSLLVGAAANPVLHDKTCKITILPRVKDSAGVKSPMVIDPVWDPEEVTRGVIVHGVARMYGEPRQHVAVVPKNVKPKAGQVTRLLRVMSGWNWESGDLVALAGTTFKRGKTIDDPLTDESFNLQIASTLGYALPNALQKPHLRATNPATNQPFDLHLVHLERNIIFNSGWSSVFSGEPEIVARGHFMAHDTTSIKDIIVEYARFDQFGRTNKQIPVDDVRFSSIDTTSYTIGAAPGFNGSVYPTKVVNRRARYAAHFHKNGYQLPGPPKKIMKGCVVTNTPGWGFVNHASYVLFEDCVVYDFAGAGFVAENGTELGTFTGCVAMHGTGLFHETKAADYIFVRGVFGDWATGQVQPPFNTVDPRFRPQPLGDFGFGGEGFWFQGPLVRATNNIANSCSGAGMFWLTTGGVHDYSPLDAVPAQKERYAAFPLADLDKVYSAAVYAKLMAMSGQGQTGPRIWNWVGGNPQNRVVLSDLPILEASDFKAYACLVGVHLRFTNVSAESWYNENPFDYDLELSPSNFHPSFPLERPVQNISNLELWNNEQGFRARYCESTAWNNVVVANEIGSYSTRFPSIGVELNHQVRDHDVNDVFVYGYELSLLVQDRSSSPPSNSDNSSELTFSPGTFADCGDYAILKRMYGRVSTKPTSTGLWPTPSSDPCQFAHDTWIDDTTVNVTGAAAPFTVSWTAKPVPETLANCVVGASQFPKAFLIRYREIVNGVKSERYKYYRHVTAAGVMANAVPVPGLKAGKQYEIQVISNFDDTIHPAGSTDPGGPLPLWSDVKTFSL